MVNLSRSLTILLAVPALVLLGGCARGPKDRLQGRWVGMTIDNIPRDQESRAMGWVKGTSFEFKGSKVTVVVPAEEPRTGEFKVTRTVGSKVTVEIKRPSGEADEATFVLADEHSIKWDIGNERQITLEKAVASR